MTVKKPLDLITASPDFVYASLRKYVLGLYAKDKEKWTLEIADIKDVEWDLVQNFSNLNTSTIVSPFGGGRGRVYQSDPDGNYNNQRPGHKHAGVDIAPIDGKFAINAVLPGWAEFLFEGPKTGYGYWARIKHDSFPGQAGTMYTIYGHMQPHTNATNRYVQSGESIGIMGSTGHSGGLHLHFGIATAANIPVDPMPYIKQWFGNGPAAAAPAPAKKAVSGLATLNPMFSKDGKEIKLTPAFKIQVEDFLSFAWRNGHQLKVKDGYRTAATQQGYYDTYLYSLKGGPPANFAVSPAESMHVKGEAVDFELGPGPNPGLSTLANDAAWEKESQWIKDNGKIYGLYNKWGTKLPKRDLPHFSTTGY